MIDEADSIDMQNRGILNHTKKVNQNWDLELEKKEEVKQRVNETVRHQIEGARERKEREIEEEEKEDYDGTIFPPPGHPDNMESVIARLMFNKISFLV